MTVSEYNKRDDKRKQAYAYFISKGYSPHASAGIVGNLVHESGLNTTIEGDKNLDHSSVGLAQWRGDRLKNLKKTYGNTWTDFHNQLEFVDKELRSTEKRAGNMLLNATTAHEAGQIFSDHYERPAKKYAENSHRRDAVQNATKLIGEDYSEQYKGGNMPVSSDIEGQPDSSYSFPDYNKEMNSIYSQVSNLPGGSELPTLAPSIEATEEEKPEYEEVDKKENISKEEKALLQRQKEHDFMQELIGNIGGNKEENSSGQSEEQLLAYIQQQQQQEQQPQEESILDKYSQVADFIEQPTMQEGGVIKDQEGQKEHPGKVTEIVGNVMTTEGYGNIPLYVVPDVGQPRIVYPNTGNQVFEGATKFTEYPLKIK